MADWSAVTGHDINDEFERLADEWLAVEWQSGSKTLLAALGIHYLEVPMCRGLAWLLDPAGGHGLGSHILRGLLGLLSLPDPSSDSAVRIIVEEARVDTRADLIIRYDDRAVIIEAKIFAGEQPRQADRLNAHWAELSPVLVFLTRTGYAPSTAIESADRWTALSWRDIAALARRQVDSANLQPSAGAREFIETIGSL